LLPAQVLLYNIFIDGVFNCRVIAIDEVSKDRRFTSDDISAMNLLGEAVHTIVHRSPHVDDGADSDFVNLTRRLLDSEKVPEREVAKVLSEYNWGEHEPYHVGFLDLNKGGMQPIVDPMIYTRYISDTFTGATPILKDNHLILIVRDQHIEDSSKFTMFVRDHNFRFGLSRISYDFYNVERYYRQARFALEQGIRADRDSWLFDFRDYAVEYIIGQSEIRMGADALCAQELVALMDYDKENHGEYVETLYSYILHRMNSAATAKALNIHIATMVYRLKRITEIGHVDFNNIKQLLYIYLSCIMMGVGNDEI
jgi:hypothetical protein